MNIFYDHATLICVAAFIILMVLWGRSKGFMNRLLSLCSVMMTLGIELRIYPAVLELLSGNEAISNFLTEAGRKLLSGVAVTVIESTAGSESGLSAADVVELADSPLYELLGLDVLADNAIALTSDVAARILCFVLIFIAIRLAVRMLCLIVSGLKMIRLIDWMDRLLGGCFGFAEGIIYVWLFMFIISGFPGYAFTSFVIGQISESAILSWLYSQNLIISFFLGMLL